MTREGKDKRGIRLKKLLHTRGGSLLGMSARPKRSTGGTSSAPSLPAGIAVIEKIPLSRSAWDAYERVLNHGVTLPAADRVGPMTMADGSAQNHLIVAVVSVETYSEVHPLSR